MSITLADRWLNRLRNNRLTAAAIVVGVLVSAVATFWNALPGVVRDDVAHWLHPELALPGDTGWIFVGYYNGDSGAFIEGPKVEVINSTIRARHFYVELGDTIRLKNPTKVYIVDYMPGRKTNKKLLPPIEKGVISSADETGVTLPAGTELIVRDISRGAWARNPNAAIWARVVLLQESYPP